MNIPLNIDWQQILLHLLNFMILVTGLYLLLYKPVKNFIEKRKQYYLDLDSKTNEKLEQAEELKTSYQQSLNGVQAEITRQKTQANQEAQQSSALLLQKAEEQAEAVISNAKEEAKQERAKILEETQRDIALMAISATEKLLANSSSGALDQFLDTVKKG